MWSSTNAVGSTSAATVSSTNNGEVYVANFFCAGCSQPLKIDPSLLEHSDLDSAVAPIIEISKSALPSQPTPKAGEPKAEDHTLITPNDVYSIPMQDSFVVLNKHSLTPLLTNTQHNSAAPEIDKTRVSILNTQPPVRPSTTPRSRRPSSATSSTGAPGLALGRVASLASISASNFLDDQPGSLSHRLKVASKYFDLLSGMTTVNHPMCQDCADELIVQLDKRLSEARKEKECYLNYIHEMEKSDQSMNEVTMISEADWNILLEKEEQMTKMKQELEKEHKAVLDDLAKAEKEILALEEEEKSHWRELNQLELKAHEQQIEKDSLKTKFEYANNRLQELKKTNVYNDAFKIWHDGPFGTINEGLRLGRLPSQPVDWSEINAALGQAVLLIDTLATKLNFSFKGYRLVPMGNFSRIEKLDGDKATYELYGSGDLKGMLFWNRRFDNALVAFLNCVQQLGDFAEQSDPKFRLPYRISHPDKIGDVSIRLQFNQDESWTKALKYTLIDIKWILAFCCTSST